MNSEQIYVLTMCPAVLSIVIILAGTTFSHGENKKWIIRFGILMMIIAFVIAIGANIWLRMNQ